MAAERESALPFLNLAHLLGSQTSFPGSPVGPLDGMRHYPAPTRGSFPLSPWQQGKGFRLTSHAPYFEGVEVEVLAEGLQQNTSLAPNHRKRGRACDILDEETSRQHFVPNKIRGSIRSRVYGRVGLRCASRSACH